MKKLCLIGLLSCLINFSLYAETTIPTVGIEGQITVEIPDVELIAKGVDRRSDMIVYIASSQKKKNAFQYDLRFIGQAPGTFNLANYLLRKDGGSTKKLKAINVKVKPLLPADDKGELIATRIRPFDIFDSYGTVITVVWILWGLLLLPILLIRHWKSEKKTEIVQPAPSLAQLLEPLIINATQGNLDAAGQANLEKMLIQHWKITLNLTSTSAYDSILKLKDHPEAGKLIQKLEEWLHNPNAKTSKEEIAHLLEPYQGVNAVQEKPETLPTSNPHDMEVK